MIVGGNLAKRIGQRFDDEAVAMRLELKSLDCRKRTCSPLWHL